MKLVTPFTMLAVIVTLTSTTRLSAQAQAPEAPAQPKQNPVADSRVIPRPSPGAQPTPVSMQDSSQVSTQVFRFNGGSFHDFVRKLGETYGTNVLELFDVPNEPFYFRIPKMRVAKATDIRAAFSTYNNISQGGDWFLGKWIYYPQPWLGQNSGELVNIVFSPPKPASSESGPGIAVRAFSIAGITPANRKSLQEIVEEESYRLRTEIERGRYGRQDPSQAFGRIAIHESTELLVATGGKTYVELVASIVDAFEKRNLPRR